MQFAGFPSIESFYHVVKLVKNYPHLAQKPFKYRGKGKIHGTNASVRLSPDSFLIQSKEQIITPEKDNVGFAKWVHSQLDQWKSIKVEKEITIYGEWCGPGIQKGTAINQIPNKVFAIFAIMIGNVGFDEESGNFIEDTNQFVIEPEEIKSMLGELPKDVYILPWFGDEFEVNFLNRISLEPVINEINTLIKDVEECDPWVKSIFNISGVSEGIVYYPLVDNLQRKTFSNFAFKAKGDKHKVNSSKQAVQIDPEVAGSIEEFVSMFVTENRLEQGLTTLGGSLEMKNIGSFLKWMSSDILKESTCELEASNLQWSQVQSYIQSACRNWFLIKNKELC